MTKTYNGCPSKRMSERPTLTDIQKAAELIAPFVHRTPVLTSVAIDDMVKARVFFKCENLQKIGAFKYRGACNAILSLSDAEAARGVATHSSGNHGAAVALAAQNRGIEANVVMPDISSRAKMVAVAGYGARITTCGTTLEDRDEALREIVEHTGAVVIHPFNDYRVITGQGTAALELLDELPDLDVVMTPVGGGGLISGTAIVTTKKSRARVIGTEPAGADDAWRSFQAGRLIPGDPPETIADGLRTGLGDLTFPIIKDLVHDIVRVSEQAIVHAMRTVWERMKLVIEPSSAVPLAALLDEQINLEGQRIGVIITGGNVDLDKLPWSR